MDKALRRANQLAGVIKKASSRQKNISTDITRVVAAFKEALDLVHSERGKRKKGETKQGRKKIRKTG